jgi:nicotinamidase-related amidase
MAMSIAGGAGPGSNSSGEQLDYVSDFVSRFTLVPDAVALILVDMQYSTGSRNHGLGLKLQEEGKAHLVKWRYDQIEDFVVPNLVRLLDGFRRRRLPVIHVTLGAATEDYSDALPQVRPILESLQNRVGLPNHRILHELTPSRGELVLNKTTFGAFASTGIDAVLRTLGIRQVVIGGISTNVCVAATALAAVDQGYQCCVLRDGCSATRQEYHESALQSFGRLFGEVLDTADAERILSLTL